MMRKGETTSLERELKKRNEELEEELKRSKEREDQVRSQLHAALDRLSVAEDAEERLCAQLGDLEAEALLQARDYHARIVSLVDQLSQAHSLLNTTFPLRSPS
ncbi:protein RESPONSE TO LOW SULFUR 3-like [Vigna radiata var. radiata]|uniref:Protein RESPONSE TO LOW SULFUR 3-like n=1 Tax=Vigna radiata var. radiata TaxID=3916 RepID=A0A1S3UDT4_VIGRR|nr:protein RESPONSE TO LOW SULFUR 3-like [Vigna radiata var. radiata]